MDGKRQTGNISGWKAAIIAACFAALGTFNLWSEWTWRWYAVGVVSILLFGLIAGLRHPRPGADVSEAKSGD